MACHEAPRSVLQCGMYFVAGAGLEAKYPTISFSLMDSAEFLNINLPAPNHVALSLYINQPYFL